MSEADPAADTFRWRARLWHLTYVGHIPAELLLRQLSSVTKSNTVLGSSIVHEASDAEAPYAHTHMAWLWERAPNLHGARLMDVEYEGTMIHPHAEHRKSIKWMQLVFTRYHAGHKLGATGKSTFVAPVAGPWQQLPPCFEWNDYVLTEVSEASDLIEGAQLAGLGVRSLHDVLLLQNAKRLRPFEHNFERESFLPLWVPEAYTSGAVGTLQIWGGVNLGKTEWALAQFANPLHVTERNDLLDFRPDWHDGIVIDKMLPRERPPAGFSLHECERLTDYTLSASIRCLYKKVSIPKGIRKIVVTNERDVWPCDPHGQIVGRRVVQLQIIERTYQ